MRAPIAAWDAVAALVDYPDDQYPARVNECVGLLEEGGLAAAAPLARLRDLVRGRSIDALQAEYVATFDFDPGCALDLGWHLFGDGPDRGPWLAAVAGDLERAGVHRSDELPDHLAHLLKLAAREDEPHAAALAARIGPPLARVHEKLAERGSPFADLIAAARCLFEGSAEERPGRD